MRLFTNILACISLSACMCIGSLAAANTLSPQTRLRVHQSTGTDNDPVSAYVVFDNTDPDAIREICSNVAFLTDGIATVKVLPERLQLLGNLTGVRYVSLASPALQMLDIATPQTGLDKVHSGYSLDVPYTGNGVIIGIVDAGFDYNHAAFRDIDGNLRITRVWEQATSTSQGHAPERFGYGLELDTPELIENSGGDIRNNSHGTHVAAIAAGSDYTAMNGALVGAAPDAEIVLVSLGDNSYDNVNISNAVSYIFDYADSRQLPCVVNLSLGAHGGPHDGSSAFDIIADALQGPGRLIIGAAGNHHGNLFHVGKSFTSAQDAALKTIVDFRGHTDAEGILDIWVESETKPEVFLIALNTKDGSEAERILVYPSENDTQSISLGRNITGEINVAGEVNPVNGKHHVTLSPALRSIRSGYAVAIEVKPGGAGMANIWADNVGLGLSTTTLEGFADPANAPSTICEIGGTGHRITSVGSYNTRVNYTLFNETEQHALPNEVLDQVSTFSGRGPTPDGRIKPEVTAPGCFISSAVSSNDGSGTLLVSYSHTARGREHMYGYMQGTSMAAPFVAGVVATWLQANPSIDPEKLKEILADTTLQSSETDYPNTDEGYGRISPLKGLQEAIRSNGVNLLHSDILDVAVKIEGSQAFIGTLTNDPVTASIYSLTGSQLFSSTFHGFGNHILSLTSLTKGVYLLRITSGSRSRTIKITVP